MQNEIAQGCTPEAALKVFLTGGRRNVYKTAKLLGISKRTAYHWAAKYGWKSHPAVEAPDLTPDLALVQARTPSPEAIARAETLDETRDRVRAKLYQSADAAADVLADMAAGLVTGGDYSSAGVPAVKPAIRLQAARALLELCGLNPPKRVEITRTPDEGYQNLRTVAARLTVSELEILVSGLDRSMRSTIDATAEPAALEAEEVTP